MGLVFSDLHALHFSPVNEGTRSLTLGCGVVMGAAWDEGEGSGCVTTPSIRSGEWILQKLPITALYVQGDPSAFLPLHVAIVFLS